MSHCMINLFQPENDKVLYQNLQNGGTYLAKMMRGLYLTVADEEVNEDEKKCGHMTCCMTVVT